MSAGNGPRPSAVPEWYGGRTWTPVEATAALPLIRRITADLLASWSAWREAVEAFEYASASTQATRPSSEADRLMGEAQRLAAEIDGFQGELARLDVRVARVEYALVAFRGLREGEVAPLYWMPGAAAPAWDWPESVPMYGTSTSWPSRAHDVAANRSRA